jgi:hypothetical protein
MNEPEVSAVNSATIKVEIPASLRLHASISGDRVIALLVPQPATLGIVLEALEAQFPALRGTLRDPATQARRAFIRFFACGEDISLTPLDHPLPEPVMTGRESLLIVGAIAGG